MSNLKHSITSTVVPSQVYRPTTSPPVEKKKKMSLTQTYMLAHSARGKLSKEAARPAHDLRRLVGHANMLDSLMLDLANAEAEQENWFNQSVKSANKAAQEPKHIHWAEAIPEEAMEEDSDEDAEADDEEEYKVAHHLPIRRVAKSPPPALELKDEDEDEEMEEDDDYDDDLALTRTASHPPELMHEDSDSESDDDSLPPSPPTMSIPFDAYTEKQRQAIATTSFYQSAQPLSASDESFFEHTLPAPIAAY